jgi:hypothetical protein
LKNNPPRTTAVIWSVITIISVTMIFVPGLIGLEGFEGGYAISFVSLFAALLGAVIVVIYVWQASILDKILRGEGLLAHWTYTSEKWSEYCKKDYAEDKAEKKGLFIVVSTFALFFGVLFWAIDAEAGFIVFLVMLGLIVTVGLAWQLSAWHYSRQNMGEVEAYIARSGLYLTGRLYAWRMLSAHLARVSLEEKRGLVQLVFNFKSLTLVGSQSHKVRVPVPDGQEETAKMIVQILSS